jgi:acetolactate synthase small subunit
MYIIVYNIQTLTLVNIAKKRISKLTINITTEDLEKVTNINNEGTGDIEDEDTNQS